MKKLEQIASATAVIMGIAIGVLTVGLGLGLVASPWELDFAADHAVAATLVGLIAMSIGVVLMVDLIDGERRPGHRR